MRARTAYCLRLLAISIIGLGSIAAPGWAEESVRPGINRPYVQPDFEQWVGRFEGEGREVYDRRDAIVSAVGIETGMTIADIGAGTGLFTRLFSPRVGGSGKVIAVDISRGFVDNIRRIAREQGMANVETVVNTPTDVLLPPASIDLAFACDTYHHFEYPRAMLGSIHRALRPGGTLVIIDYQRVPGMSSHWVMDHVRAGKETVITEIEAAGFQLVEDKPLLTENYFLRFRRMGTDAH